MSISRRIDAAESRLPPKQLNGAEKLRLRIRNTNEAGWFVCAFGSHSEYLEVSTFAIGGDFAGALGIAERVNSRSEGAAIDAYASLDLGQLPETLIVRLSELLKQPHPLAQTAVAELQEIIHRACPSCPVAPA